MIFNWHNHQTQPAESIDLAVMVPCCTVGGDRRPLRIEPMIHRLHRDHEAPRYYTDEHGFTASGHLIKYGVWLLWEDFEAAVQSLPEAWTSRELAGSSFHDPPRDRALVFVGLAKSAHERCSTVYWDPTAVGQWSPIPGNWRTITGMFHPRVIKERGLRWCEPADIFTPAMLREDAAHRARAGDRY